MEVLLFEVHVETVVLVLVQVDLRRVGLYARGPSLVDAPAFVGLSVRLVPGTRRPVHVPDSASAVVQEFIVLASGSGEVFARVLRLVLGDKVLALVHWAGVLGRAFVIEVWVASGGRRGPAVLAFGGLELIVVRPPPVLLGLRSLVRVLLVVVDLVRVGLGLLEIARRLGGVANSET